MKISPIYNYTTTRNMTYNKHQSKNEIVSNHFVVPNFEANRLGVKNKFSFEYFNPVNIYLNKLLQRSLEASRKRILPVIDELKAFTKEVSIGESVAWDINPNNRDKYIVFLHGASQNITNNQDLYNEIIKNTDYAVIAAEYRGFGKTTSNIFSEITLEEDTQAVYEYLTKEKKISPQNIETIGHSFGGFISAQMTYNHPDISHQILVSSIDFFENGAINFERNVRNRVPKAISFLFKNFKFLRKQLVSLFQTDKFVGSNVPTDIIHSVHDRIVNKSSSQNLSEKCNLTSLTFLPKGGHQMDKHKIDTIISILKNR